MQILSLLLQFSLSLAPCRFYFAYCEAAFDAKYIHNFQTTWLKAGEAAGACPSSSQEASAEAPLAARAAEPADPFTQACTT